MHKHVYPVVNDDSCGWMHTTRRAPEFPPLGESLHTNWLIIGAGYTGLAAAYRLAELCPGEQVVLVDAEQPGAGASSRNSGYIVDITLNDGGASLADDRSALQKSQLNMAGLALLRRQVREYSIDCDWDEAGKLHCAADPRHLPKLERFAAFLERAGVSHRVWQKGELAERLGSDFYLSAVQTLKGVLVNPAGLVSGLLENLPPSVRVYAQTPVLDIQAGEPTVVRTPGAQIRADRVIVAVNALMPRLGFKRDRVFPLTLSASLSRPLDDAEYRRIGEPAPWGVLSASSFGATVRLTNDRRILVRNTVEWWPRLHMNAQQLAARRNRNMDGLRRRFPGLPNLNFDYTWSGQVCLSRNSKPVFEKSDEGLYLAGCYNAGGIAMGSLFGRLIVDHALGEGSEELSIVLAQPSPSHLPPRPLLDVGVRSRLAWQRFQGRNEA